MTEPTAHEAAPSQELELRPQEKWMADKAQVEIVKTDAGDRMYQLTPELAQRTNMLMPVSSVIQLSSNWSPVIRMTTLEVDVDTYKVGSKKKQGGGWEDIHALTAIAHHKLADLCGIEHTRTERKRDTAALDTQVTARVRGADGLWKYVTRSDVIEWETWEALQLEKVKDKSEAEKRKFLLEQRNFAPRSSETKAFDRCIDAFLSMKTFPKSRLSLPFVAMTWALTPDYSKPGTAEIVRLQYGDTVGELYGGEEIAPPEIEAGHLDPAAMAGELEVHDPPRAQEEPPEEEEVIDGQVVGDGEGAQAAFPDDTEDEPEIPKPEKNWKLRADSKSGFAGMSAEQLAQAPEGRAFLCDTARNIEAKRESALAWLSWGLQREVTLENLDTVDEQLPA